MNFRQLSYFIEVYHRKSIKKAAEYLMISEQGLSKTIKLLEEELHTCLFARGRNSIEPTPEADRLLKHAETIVEQLRIIETPQFFSRRKVVLYAMDGIMDYYFLPCLVAFHKAHPTIQLKVIETSYPSAIDHLRRGDSDLAVIQPTYDYTNVACEFLFEDRFCMVVPKDHPLAQKRFLTAADLDGALIAGRGSSYVLYEEMFRFFETSGAHPITILESNNEKILLSMPENGLAFAAVSEQVALRNASPNTAVCILQDHQTYERIFLARLCDRPLSTEAALLRDFLLDYAKEHLQTRELVD